LRSSKREVEWEWDRPTAHQSQVSFQALGRDSGSANPHSLHIIRARAFLCIASSLAVRIRVWKVRVVRSHWKSSSELSERPLLSERRTEDTGWLEATVSYAQYVLEEWTERYEH
jgi:hypothetical protein